MAVLLYHNQAIFELRTDNDGDDKKSSPIKSSDHTGSFSSSSYQESRFLPSFFFFSSSAIDASLPQHHNVVPTDTINLNCQRMYCQHGKTSEERKTKQKMYFTHWMTTVLYVVTLLGIELLRLIARHAAKRLGGNVRDWNCGNSSRRSVVVLLRTQILCLLLILRNKRKWLRTQKSAILPRNAKHDWCTRWIYLGGFEARNNKVAWAFADGRFCWSARYRDQHQHILHNIMSGQYFDIMS